MEPRLQLEQAHDSRDSHDWERVRRGGLLRFILTRALPFYGVPFAFLMWVFSTPDTWLAGLTSCSLRALVFASVMGWLAWRLEEAAHSKRLKKSE
jgi:hypothetical protein